ncbi:uncharacterized protein LOC143412797 [Maylandia zebra]|uniref:uncharacterized protein LOC143412797 n=1 Tax=Maylandia zebra TaxID=106582 RepID=UPI00403C8008
MEKQKVLWKRFFVISARKTSEAHHSFIKRLKSIDQMEVTSAEKSDYLLIFCPVNSQVGADIAEALDKIPRGKPVILVVMHHTSNLEHVVAESWRQVKNENVHLTVDCLVYKGKLLDCSFNDIMWCNIGKFFRVSIHQLIQTSKWRKCSCYTDPLILGVGFIMCIMIVATVTMEVVRRMI